MLSPNSIYILQTLAGFCLGIDRYASRYRIIMGNEAQSIGEEGGSGAFHECSIDATCTHVLRHKNTGAYRIVRDKNGIDNVSEGTIVWEKIAINPSPSCKYLKRFDYKSGLYDVILPSGVHQVYCDMVTNGGGYTFLSSDSVARINQSDVNHLLTSNQDVLLRILKPDGLQPYTVIEQYKKTGGLSIQHSNYDGYTRPRNDALSAFMFLGTLPASLARNRENQGFISNGISLYFRNCDENPNSYFAFFSKNVQTASSKDSGLGVRWRDTAINDHQSQIPRNFFMFTEMHYGGCGVYTESAKWPETANAALGTAIGVR